MLSTPRGIRSLRFGTIVLDSDREGPAYFKRVWKYQNRGWRVAVPGFDELKLSPSITNGAYYLLPKREVLVKAGPTELVDKEIGIPTCEVVGQRLRSHEIKVKCSFLQRCTLVRGIEFLLAQNYGYVKTAVRKDNLVAVPLVRDNTCLLLWSQPSDESDDDVDFSAVPVSAVDTLLEKCLGHTTEGSCGCWPGGAVRKSSVVTELRESVLVHLHTETHLDFVYDFVRNYSELAFVKDAGRAPLQGTDDADFFKRYGLEKTLSFKRATRRTPTRSDWWSAAYKGV